MASAVSQDNGDKALEWEREQALSLPVADRVTIIISRLKYYREVQRYLVSDLSLLRLTYEIMEPLSCLDTYLTFLASLLLDSGLLRQVRSSLKCGVH